VAAQNFSTALCAPVAEPSLSEFLNLPLRLIPDYLIAGVRSYSVRLYFHSIEVFLATQRWVAAIIQISIHHSFHV